MKSVKRKSRYKQGVYNPKYPEKYQGTVPIIYRSSWEKRFMVYLDLEPSVILWASESLVVPYISPVDNRPHRYFVDFLAQMKRKDGSVKNYAIELKPKKEMMEPKQPKKIPRDAKKIERLITEANTYSVNKAKWEAADEYCRKRNVTFIVLNEEDIGIV